MAEAQSIGKLLKELIQAKKWSATVLARHSAIPLGTVQAYLQDARRPSGPNIKKLAKALSDGARTPDLIELRLTEASRQNATRLSWFERLDKPDAQLRSLHFNYPPVTNGKDYFIDKLLARLFTLAVIKESPGDKRGFNLRHRAQAVWNGEADMLTGLCTLPRLKLLHYYLIPIRISIGAVIHRQHRPQIKALQQALIGRMPYPMKVFAVEGEIGEVHARQTAKINQIVFVEDLDPSLLAQTLITEQESTDTQRGIVPLICCDEITAMRVLAELGERGCLVFPPSTAESIQDYEERKELPAHLAGFAVSRRETELIQYLDHAFNLLLETEVESIAHLWFGAYKAMFKNVCEWLKGRIEISSNRPLTLSERQIGEHRIARAYSRRVFRLSRSGVESCRQGHASWVNILHRAREIFQKEAARNRTDIRTRVLDIAAKFFGMSIDWTSENINSLLAKGDADSTFERDFLLALRDEFDIELSLDVSQTSNMSHLEGIVSLVQRALEIDAGHTHQARVLAGRPAQSGIFKSLLREFERTLEVSDISRLAEDDIADYFKSGDALNTKIVLFATYMQQTHGFIMMTSESHGQAMRLERLYVQETARTRGLGANLVRRAIEISADANCTRVFMYPMRFNTQKDLKDENTLRLIRLLTREGFAPTDNSREFYEYVIKNPQHVETKASTASF